MQLGAGNLSSTNIPRSETEHAPPSIISYAPSREDYRKELRIHIRQVVDEQGIIALLDWCNKVTEELHRLEEYYKIDNLDILQEELANLFLEKYPPFRSSKYVQGKNTVRLPKSVWS
jgi:hypothetical protein